MISYDLKIKTRDTEDAASLESLYITLFGVNGKTPAKLVSDKGFARGTENIVIINSVSVGYVKGISLSIQGLDNWKPEYIVVRYLCKWHTNILVETGFQENIFTFPITAVLNDPGKPLTIRNHSWKDKISRDKESTKFDEHITSMINFK